MIVIPDSRTHSSNIKVKAERFVRTVDGYNLVNGEKELRVRVTGRCMALSTVPFSSVATKTEVSREAWYPAVKLKVGVVSGTRAKGSFTYDVSEFSVIFTPLPLPSSFFISSS